MRFFRSLSARFHLAMGLSSLTVSVLLLTVFAKIIPSTDSLISGNRSSMAEAVASAVSIFLNNDNFADIQNHLGFLVERNPDLIGSQVIRLSDSSNLILGDESSITAILDAQAKGASADGEKTEQAYSTDQILRVPLKRNGTDWGSVTLFFESADGDSLLAKVKNSTYAPIVFIGFLCFCLFYWYLGKMLKQLNPSQAVPGRVRSALDTIAESLLVINRKGDVVLANRAFADLVGAETDALVGKSSDEFGWERKTSLADPDSQDAPEGELGEYPWTTALSTSTTVRNSIMWLTDHEGKRRKFLVNCSPVMGDEKEAGGVLISLDDVTLLEEIELQLIESKEQAEIANKAKSSFLSNMSHEIRTPMTAILGFTEVLRRGYGSDPQATAKHLDTIASSGAHLLELINDVLDLSKVESGVLEIEQIPCKPHKIVNDVVSVLNVKAAEKQIELDFSIDGQIPFEIGSDPSRIRQIITNLIGNAIKFTSEGGVRVRLAADRTADSPMFRFEISDSGIGMTQKQCDSIFEAFVQADSSITRRFGGTGLGLSISKKLAIALGGDITVSSVPGEGSTFNVDIPCNVEEGCEWFHEEELLDDLTRETHQADSQWQLPGSKVLVVDDAHENRELLSLVLEEMGAIVQCAVNGKDGVEKFEAGDFEIVLMDIQMPVMDGYQAAGRLREIGTTCPIVALTANAMKGFEKKVLSCGFSHYMTKPIDIDKLSNLMAELLGGTRVQKNDSAVLPVQKNTVDTSAGMQSGSALNTVSSEDLRNELVETNPKFESIANEFAKTLALKLPKMQEAVDKADLKEVAALAHWLKGSGGSVGFVAFTEPAKKLENAALAGDQGAISEPMVAITELSARLQRQTARSQSGIDRQEGISRSEAAASQQASPHENSVDGGISSVGPIRSSLPAQNPKFIKIVRDFCVKLDANLDDMERAIEARDYTAVAHLSHWLKGSGGNVGFLEFGKPASNLEELAHEQTETGMTALLVELRSLASRIELPQALAQNDSDVTELLLDDRKSA